MAKRAAYTLLLIRPDLLARADFGPLPQLELLGFWQQPQNGNVRLYYSIEAGLGLGDNCGRTVWVIGEEFWTQTLSLPASAMGGLDREQVRKAIAFDVEALTGIAGAESAIGFCQAAASDESEHYWVTQIANLTRGQIQKSVEAAGGVLAGIVHPGGLPLPVDPKAIAGSYPQSWRRIEVWKDATVCITGRSEQPQRVKVINGDPGQDAWRTSVTRWINSNPADLCEWLGPQGSMADKAFDANGSPWTLLAALTDDALKGWLTRWAGELASGPARVPVVTPAGSAAVPRKLVMLAAVLALVTLLACGGRGMWLNQQLAAAVQEREEADAPKRQLADLDKRISTLQADLLRERSKAASVHRPATHDPSEIERQRTRLKGLLATLAEQANENVVIDHMVAEADGVILIEGKCSPSASVDDFAQKLAAELPDRGWEITPAQKLAPDGANVGDPSVFRLRVKPWPASTRAPVGAVAGTERGGMR